MGVILIISIIVVVVVLYFICYCSFIFGNLFLIVYCMFYIDVKKIVVEEINVMIIYFNFCLLFCGFFFW